MSDRVFKLSCAIAVVMIATVTECAVRAAQYTDGIAAVVDGEVITVFDVVRQTNQLEARLAERYRPEELAEKVVELRRLAAARLVEQELIFAEYRDRKESQPGFGLPEDFVQRNLDRVVVQEAGGDWAKFRAMLEERGMTLAEFREDLTKRLAVDVMVDEMVRRPIRVSVAEVEAYYTRNQEEFTRPDRIKLAIIFLKGERNEALSNAAAVVRQRLEAGEDFANVSRDVSDDAVSAARGGELDWIDTRSGRKVFVEAASKLAKGEFAGPLETEEGLFFIKLLDTEAAETRMLDAPLRQAIQEKLMSERQQSRYDQFIDRLKQKFYVKTFF